MPRPIETLAQRLAHARRSRGLTQEQLATRAGMRQPDISKIEKGLILQTTGIARLASALAVEADWLELGQGEFEPSTQYDGPPVTRTSNVAHAVSQATPIVTPRQIKWEDLLTTELTLPFQMVIQGDELAPDVPAGTTGRFTPGAPIKPGRPALIQDRDGMYHLRIYQLGAGGRWQGISKQPGYAALDSLTDGLTIVAPMTGLDWN